MTRIGRHATRRAPGMERYVSVYGQRGAWRVLLKVGGQSFFVGPECDTKAEALWFRDMLCIALSALVDGREPSR